MSTARPAPGWYRDPSGRHASRYWDGASWTPHVRGHAAHRPDPVHAVPHGRPNWPSRTRIAVAAGAALIVLGGVLPWAHAQIGALSVTKDGIDGDGAVTTVFAACILVALIVVEHPRRQASLVVALGAVAAAVALYEAADTSSKAEDLTRSHFGAHASAGVGIGVWITVAGAIFVVAGGVVALTRRPARMTAARSAHAERQEVSTNAR